jgi:hypothetical protein
MIQDAVTLAADLERTPVQRAAKRVYDSLVDAQSYCIDLSKLSNPAQARACSPALLANRLDRDIEYAIKKIVELMHEDDCE